MSRDSPIRQIDWPRLCQHLRLTPRQAQVVQLIVEEDLTAAAIGQCLGITERTAMTHINAIKRQHGLRTRAGIVSTAWAAWMQLCQEDAAG